MRWVEEFSQDHEFSKLLKRHEQIDLTVAALEVARDGRPNLDFHRTLDWIDRRGDELRGPISRAKNEQVMLRELSKCLSGTHGLHGSKDAFQTDESSFIHRVIETGQGIPISLSVVYMAVARAAGLELEGVATPLHFLTRFDTASGPLFLDAFHNGQVLDYDACVSWLTSVSGLTADDVEETLEPATSRDIVVRMLNNLKALYVRREQWGLAWNVQRRLTALHPSHYDAVRDLALVAVKANQSGVAVDLLQRCLKACPDDERQMLKSHLDAAERQLANWN